MSRMFGRPDLYGHGQVARSVRVPKGVQTRHVDLPAHEKIPARREVQPDRPSASQFEVDVDESRGGLSPPSHAEYFEAKPNDCETELCETQVWLEFALACEYITLKEYDGLDALPNEVGSLLNYMAPNPKKFM